MNSSESIADLTKALSKATEDIEKAEKDKENPHFRSKYADLGNVIDAIKPALVKNGLTFTQICHEADNAAKIETVILHSSGEWLSCGCVSVPVSKSDAQGFGSALTYARRYSLSAAFGVAPEDDDGNAASKAAPKQAKKASEQAKPPAQQTAKTESTGSLSESQSHLLNELGEYFTGDPEQMAETLKILSYYAKDDKEGWLKIEDLEKPKDHAGFQKWVGSTLGKFRKWKEQQTANPF